jgi:nitric oxide reductase subunit B
MWYAHSYEFMQDSTLQTLRWMRIFGDSIFAIGSVALALFVIGLKTGWPIDKTLKEYE